MDMHRIAVAVGGRSRHKVSQNYCQIAYSCLSYAFRPPMC